ncbi:MAG: DUF3488 and transglutaminase-like domain-containing protein [Caldisericia bacterium]|jgi:transglutaminase-like putative cysteine protease|nr:DUF3488 and transglutaminase-like domain-containing protein [Caldisericia bacterium]
MNRIEIKKVLNILTYLIGFEMFIFSFKNISYPYFLISSFIFLISIYRDFIKYFRLNRVLLNIVAIIFIILIFLRVTLQDIITPALESLIVLLSIKFLEDKEKRDYLQIFLISILIFTGATIFSFEISFLVFFLIFILLINFSIIFLTYYSEDKNLKLKTNEVIKIVKKAILIPIIALPFSAILFFGLPRSPNPLFSFFGSTLTAKTGFSETVKLGTVSEIQEDDSVIFRVSTEKLNDSELYFRGITLNYYENNEWSYVRGFENTKNIEITGKLVEQTIYLEPYGGNYLFSLDKPIAIYSFLRYETEGLNFKTREIISNKVKYEAKSIISDVIYEKGIDKNFYTQLPKNLSNKFYELAKSFNGNEELEVIKNVQNYFLSGEFKYNLKNLPVSENPIEDFLFKTKEGNCEYFATSMALILRALQIPSRVVAGYKGGIYNEIGKYYIIKQSDAHLWVEAYIDNIGWIRLDPTPSSQRDFALLKSRKISKFRIFLDTINYYYNTFVINYDLEKQIALLNKIRDIRFDFKLKFNLITLFKNLNLFLIVASMLLVIFLLKGFKFERIQFEDKIIKLFYKKLKKLHIKKEKYEGLHEVMEKIKDERIKSKIKEFIINFEEYYYKDEKFDKLIYLKLKRLLNEI